MNMKEELTALFEELLSEPKEFDLEKITDAIEKYDKYIRRLNLDAQRWFDLCMDMMHERNKKDER